MQETRLYLRAWLGHAIHSCLKNSSEVGHPHFLGCTKYVWYQKLTGHLTNKSIIFSEQCVSEVNVLSFTFQGT